MNTYALSLIKKFEGCRLTAYQDSVGVWTIGWGHTGLDVTPNKVITQAVADSLRNALIVKLQRDIEDLLKVTLGDPQIGALISFVYNLGLDNLKKSTLLKKINDSDPDAADEFLKWNRAGGRILKGLTARRSAERDVFLLEA